ncbi:hypothetical protein KY290_026118 [Solanum tuberosum]|uniref:Retrotransposon gag domain-containing protein n=1 Tax=Solanum tuberosum TaxID=4113 RepID=A0ABQ7UWL3_SOLTU|nr:hypothetical protein KY284_024975 [Solanum tuberosum]KAH0755848.1 hypothetical protein KY290_026118 [Solanum tuberosum]
MTVTKSKNQDKSVEEIDDRLAQIQDQLKKLMEGMTSMNDRNSQKVKELYEIKETIGRLGIKGKEKELGRAESSMHRACSVESQHEIRHKENHSNSGNLFTRFSRLEFPIFFGQDLRTWLYKVDQFFAMEEVAFDQRVRVTSIHLEGEAIAWHRLYMRSRSCVANPSWKEYILALNERFREEFEDSMEALKNLTQIGSVKEYQAELQEDVIDAQAKTWGLKPMVRQVQGPILPTRTHVKPPFSQKPFTPNPTYRKPVDSQVSKPNRFTGNGLGRRLTVVEMDEKRAKGLCFFCDDNYVGTTVTSDFLLLPLGSVDIILGYNG